MEWKKLLTLDTLGKDNPENSTYARTAFQRDYNLLVFSSPFRRLKDKTQVFSFAKNDDIGTRLTHSVEVSCVGRYLGTIVGSEIIARNNLKQFSPSDFGDIISAACIAHDIGNPPFGHVGENAIRNAFKTWYDTSKDILKDTLTAQEKADFELFEGNAQCFRILTSLEIFTTAGGMKLSCPTLAAIAKYPRESWIPADILNGYTGKSVTKYGLFQSEKDVFAVVAETVGLIRHHPEAAWWSRHPLNFLVEAADDICFHIMDLEDGYRMGYISFAKAKELLNEIAQCETLNKDGKTESEQINLLRNAAIEKLVQEIAIVFLEQEQKLLTGTMDTELCSQSTHATILKEISHETYNKVFINPDVISIQIGGYEILVELFVEFANAILLGSDKGKLLRHLLPDSYRIVDNESCYSKILKITDYLSSITDSYATTLFKQIKGICLK